MRHERFVLAAGLSVAIVWAGCASDEQPPPAGGRARVYSSMGAQPLTRPSKATPVALVAGFLAEHGAAAGDMLRVASQRRADTGLTHVRMEQVVDGLRVDRKSTRLNSSHSSPSRMPSSA